MLPRTPSRIAVLTLKAALVAVALLAAGALPGTPAAPRAAAPGAALPAGASPTPTATLPPTPTPPLPTPTPDCKPAWAIVDSPNPSHTYNELYGVAALASDDVWAVGVYADPQSHEGVPLTEHWNGADWTFVPSPTIYGLLSDVAGVATDDVWAVGDAGGPLIEHWDGAGWSISYRQRINAVLRGVVAVAPDDVWAVGNLYSAPQATLIMHWNGTTWSVVSSPNAGPYDNELWGIAAAGPDDIWAVGYFVDGPATESSLVEHWDGQQWQVIPSPNPPGSPQNLLRGVSAGAANNAWAVGASDNSPVGEQLLTEHWDGAQWMLVPGPSDLDTAIGMLYRVVTLAPQAAWAVGYYGFPGQPPDQTLTLHWDGARWTRVASPSPGALDNNLEGLAVLPSGEAWAVGYLWNANYVWLTVVEHLAAPCVTPSPTPLTPLPTATPSPTHTPSPPPTATPCVVTFTDVYPTDYFYQPVLYLACHGIVSGYADGTFRPYTNTIRGQLAKIVVLAEGWPIDTSGGPHFADVPPANSFYDVIETAYRHGIISGYADGTFGWGADVTRAQLCKIVVLAQAWPIDTSGGPHFADVPPTNPFYGVIETAYHHGIISGYADGTIGWGAAATRGQIAQIVYLARTGRP